MGKNTQETTLEKNILREFSSGGVVYKKTNKGILWLVAASMPSELFPDVVWRLPKGWIDNDTPGVPGSIASGKVKATEESLQSAATREVSEEGGVVAKIVAKIGSEKYFFKHHTRGQILKFVTFYLMEWQKDLPEGYGGETSEIVWLPFDAAKKKITYSSEKKVLQKAKEILEKSA